jgi:polyferredoxin
LNNNKTRLMKYNKRLWKIYVAAVIFIIAVTFSPVIIAPGKISPSLGGLPFTLWASMLTTIALVVLTYLGSRVSPNDEEENK